MDEHELMPLDACSHPKLASWRDILSGAYCYQCMSCGSEIDVPLATLHTGGQDALAGIVGLAFGERWQERVRGDMQREGVL